MNNNNQNQQNGSRQHQRYSNSSSQPRKKNNHDFAPHPFYQPFPFEPPFSNSCLEQRQLFHSYPPYHVVQNPVFPRPNRSDQRGWGKRPHKFVEVSSVSTTMPTLAKDETSPSPKRPLNNQKSFKTSDQDQSSSEMTLKQPNQQSPQKKKEHVPYSKFIQNIKEKQWSELFKETLEKLEGCKAGDEVNLLLAYLQPARSESFVVRDRINSDMLKLLAPLGAEKLLVFGSTLTGLDFVGSDLDYYIQLKIPPKESEDIKNIFNRTGKLTRSCQNRDFRIIYNIMSARVPIIRFIHQRTRTVCDINFTSQFGYHNSCFIGNVLSYDSRIKDLAVILKLWSKSNKIAEKMIVSNYSLIMLMIFYLQNLEQPMLDTIKNNQSTRSPRILDDKYKWNIYFNNNINQAESNCLSTRQLLIGFFEFYHKLNYSDYIVSLYTGGLILKQDFDTHPELSGYRKIIEETSLPPIVINNPQALAIQDGFELNLNIGIKSQKNVIIFFELIKASFEKCMELNEGEFSTLLLKLFTDIRFPESANENKNKGKAKKKFMVKIHSTAGDLKLCQDILTSREVGKICTVEDQQALFFSNCCDGTIKFLKEIYLCTLTPKEDNDNNLLSKELRIALDVDTVNGRKKMNFKDETTVNAEINLSKKMSEKKVRFDLDVNMKIYSADQGKTVDYEMICDTQSKSTLQAFGNFFAVNISQALRFYLKKNCDAAMDGVVSN